MSSQNHPKINKLVERMVQNLMKQRLPKYGLQKGRAKYWDL
jgi:hypothetical protein